MRHYILRRLLLALPTLGVVTLLAFALCIQAPGDPITSHCPNWESGVGTEAYRQCRERQLQKFGWHLPLFYLSIGSLAEPVRLSPWLESRERAAYRELLYHYGHPDRVAAYWAAISELIIQSRSLPPPQGYGDFTPYAAKEHMKNVQAQCRSLLISGNPAHIEQVLQRIDSLRGQLDLLAVLDPALAAVDSTWAALPAQASRWRYYVPWVRWHGAANQYHRWLSGVLRGDFGISYTYHRPIKPLISGFIGWTVLFTGLAVVIAYLLGIPLGILAAAQAGRAFDRWLAVLLFALHALPAFWVATLLRLYFKDSSLEVVFDEQAPWTEMPRQMVLPLIAYTFGAFTYLSRTLRASLLDVLNQDYIRTARAAGISSWRILTRHALRNAWGPIITLFVGVFPALISGSVILERIFDIDGMGHAVYQATLQGDAPMLLAVFFLTGCLTILGYLLADILYALADPRITRPDTRGPGPR